MKLGGVMKISLKNFHFLVQNRHFFIIKTLKKGTFCAKIKKKYFCIPEIKLGEEMIIVFENLLFNAKYAIFDH